MRRFFITLLVLSLFATAGTLYWRTFLPEVSAPQSAPATRGLSGEQGPGAGTGSARDAARMPSDRQDMAVTISILSSVISAVAAVAQTLLTARAIRR
jgi:hypothetical protein